MPGIDKRKILMTPYCSFLKNFLWGCATAVAASPNPARAVRMGLRHGAITRFAIFRPPPVVLYNEFRIGQ